MPGTQENTFDEKGNTIAGGEGEGETVVDETDDDAGGEGEGEGDGTATAAGDKAKYRIGDQEFNSLAEAQAYATQQVQTGDENAAYRRLVQDIITAKPGSGEVTPPAAAAPTIDEEKLWANPTEFLQNFANDIKKQTTQEMAQSLHATRVQQQNDDAIFAEFTNRHPDLADFRTEVEQYTAQNRQTVGNLANTKGRTAAYDYVALNLRDKFAKYADATKPRRVLKNGAGNAAPAGRGTSVTPPGKKNKPLSLAEQIRTIKKVKR